ERINRRHSSAHARPVRKFNLEVCMLSIRVFKFGELIPVPESVGVCPDCDGRMQLNLDKWERLLEENNLYLVTQEVFCYLVCENAHDFLGDPLPLKEWEERYAETDERDEAWINLGENVSQWLGQIPFLIKDVPHTPTLEPKRPYHRRLLAWMPAQGAHAIYLG